MPIYEVTLKRLVEECAYITVEADDEEAAEEQAIALDEEGDVDDWEYSDMQPTSVIYIREKL